MPSGKRQTTPCNRLESEVLVHFSDRILSFDLAASKLYLELMVRARLAGRAIGTSDGYIAATAAANKLSAATRDTSPFEAAGLQVINPWTL